MRLVKFRDNAGYVRTGDWKGESIISSNKEFSPEDVDILNPIEPTKIVGVGRNYESNHGEYKKYPEFPRIFFKPPHTIVSHNQTAEIPNVENDIIYEAEVGVVIGEQCKSVSKEDAEDVIQGYICVNDLSQRIDSDKSPFGVRIKAFDNAAPIGPVVASPELVPQDAKIQLYQNGNLKQSGSFDETIYSTPELIEKITEYVTLEPGDIIATGTPPGIGPVHDGDEILIEIEGIGQLKHNIRISD